MSEISNVGETQWTKHNYDVVYDDAIDDPRRQSDEIRGRGDLCSARQIVSL